MDKLKATLVLAVGAASALPGIAALRGFEVPGGSRPQFEFVLAVFSAAIVLLVYSQRSHLSWTGWRFAGGVLAGLVLIAACFGYQVWVSNHVLVAHEAGDEPTTEFVPFFLPQSVTEDIAQVGSRRRYLEEKGPDALQKHVTEDNVTYTLLLMLGIQALLVSLLAFEFTLLGVRAID